MALEFQNDNGFAVSGRDRLTISPPRIEPDAGPERRDDEYQFGVRLDGERFGVSLLAAASVIATPVDGVERFRLDDVAAVRQILKIRERSGAVDSSFDYVRAFSVGLLWAVAGSDERSSVRTYVVSTTVATLIAAGVPTAEIPASSGARIELARLDVPRRNVGGAA